MLNYQFTAFQPDVSVYKSLSTRQQVTDFPAI